MGLAWSTFMFLLSVLSRFNIIISLNSFNICKYCYMLDAIVVKFTAAAAVVVVVEVLYHRQSQHHCCFYYDDDLVGLYP